MRKKLYLLFFLGCFYSNTHAQPLHTYTFSATDSLQQQVPRNILVFIHTDWCRFCRAMMDKTLRNPAVADILNQDYYFIPFHAEEKSPVLFKGRFYQYQGTGPGTGTHELAEKLGRISGKVSYPTICILSPEQEILFQYDQFLSAEKMILLLKAFRQE